MSVQSHAAISKQQPLNVDGDKIKYLSCHQGCCVRDHKPTLSSPQSTTTITTTGTTEEEERPADENIDKETLRENKEKQCDEDNSQEKGFKSESYSFYLSSLRAVLE